MVQDFDLLKGAKRLEKVPTSGIRDVMNKAAALRAQGHDVIPFSAGEPSFNTPEPIKQATIKMLEENHTHYSANRGQLALRKAIAEKTRKDTGTVYDPETEILVTCGGAEGLNDAIFCMVDPGDEVIILKPAFINYESLVTECGGVVVDVNLRPENNFEICIEDIAAKITDKTKMLVINNPCNPTGAVYTKEQLEALCQLAVEHNFMILSDEMYSVLTYDGTQFHSVAEFPGMKEHAIIVNGFSKTYAMTGWRLGYILAAAPITEVMVRHHQYATTTLVTFIQDGAAEAMNTPETMAYVDDMCQQFARRKELMVEGLKKLPGISFASPHGAFYIMVNVSGTGMDGKTFADRLLNEKYVAVVPAICLGAHCGDFVRISFATDEARIKEGLKRMEEFLA